MKRNYRRISSIALVIMTIFSVSGCGNKESRRYLETFIPEKVEISVTSAITATDGSIYISGYEWGPGVSKIIVALDTAVDGVELSNSSIETKGEKRSVTTAYLSDAKGDAVEGQASYVTFALETTSKNASPFIYNTKNQHNKWANSYSIKTRFIVEVNEQKQEISFEKDCISNRICPSTEVFANRGTYTGTYINPWNKEEEEQALSYAAFEPEPIRNDTVQNPLIIWLHGGSEGGTDPDITLLGNEVTALAQSKIQSYFTTEEGKPGAYVLSVQCPTYWMDCGDGKQSKGDVESRYTKVLMDTIMAYVEENVDVDLNRIYIGGCSNGGYMTLNLLIDYPNYWAASYLSSEAYAHFDFERDEDNNYIRQEDDSSFESIKQIETEWMTKEKIDRIKNIPIWFLHTENDRVVNAESYSLPTYQALLRAGATNCWFSYFKSVLGDDDPGVEYPSHLSWIYLFNNQVSKVQDRNAIASAKDQKSYGFVASRDGGTEIASDASGSYDNIFTWLNSQIR